MKLSRFSRGMQLAIVAVLCMLAGCGGGGSGGGDQSAGPVGTTPMPTPMPPAPTPPPPTPPAPPPDIEPDAFAFGALVDVTPNSLVVFNSIQIAGVNQPVTVAITGGEYAMDDGLFTTANSIAMNGQRIRVRTRASAAFSAMTSGSLAIGTVSREFRVTTEAEDLIPDTFAFGSSVDAAPQATVLSNTVVIAGINSPAAVRIQGGSYQIDGGAFTTAALSIRNGQSLTLRVTASAATGTLTRATVSVNDVSAVFNVTTAGTLELDAPTAAVIFPPRNSATSGTTVSVVGTAADAQEITSVRVNGVTATSNDGFRNWRAVVPLGSGLNILRVSTTDVAGNTNGSAVEQDFLRHEPLQPPAMGTGLVLNGLGSLTLDPAARRLYGVTGGNIVAIDTVSGDRQVFSPATGREGLGFGGGLALDARRQRLLLVDSTAEGINSSAPFSIIAVSTVDGTRTVVADANTGSGAPLRVPGDIAVDSDNAIAYVTNSSGINNRFGNILSIDLITGERRIFSDAPNHPGKLELDAGRLLVEQAVLTGRSDEDEPDGLYSLRIADKRLTPIANNDELFLLSSFTLDKKNNQLLYIVAVFELFEAIDLTTLRSRTLTSSQVGTGESIRPNGVVLDASGKFVYTFSFNPQDRGAVYAVELRSGDRVLISR